MTRTNVSLGAGEGPHGGPRLALLVTLVVVAWIPVMLSLYFSSYSGTPFFESLTFSSRDGWCDPASDGFGSHCFGDFGLLYYVGGSPQAIPPHGFTDGNINATSTPLVVWAFQVANVAPYRLLLLAVFAVYVSAMAALMLVSTRGLAAPTRAVVTVFGDLLSVGFLSALDRGNHVALMGPLLGLLILARRPAWRVFALALLISIKFWGIVFILIMLRERRYKEALLAVGLAIVINVAALFAASGSVVTSGLNMFKMVTSREVADMVAPYSISLVATLRKASCLAPELGACPSEEATTHSTLLMGSIALFVILLFVAWIALGRRLWSPYLRYTPVVGLIVLGLPEAQIYVLVLVPVLTALLAVEARNGAVYSQPRWLDAIVISAIALTTAPIAFSAGIRTADGSDFLIRWQYVVSPTVWAVSLGAVVLALSVTRAHMGSSRPQSLVSPR